MGSKDSCYRGQSREMLNVQPFLSFCNIYVFFLPYRLCKGVSDIHSTRTIRGKVVAAERSVKEMVRSQFNK